MAKFLDALFLVGSGILIHYHVWNSIQTLNW
jgi:hypothetical protein